MTEKILVTGSTGLVGLHVVKHLSGKGYQVVAGVRASSNTQKLDALKNSGRVDVELVDIQDVASISAAMTGCAAVVHCAGAVDPHARREDILTTNVGGTSNVLQAAIKNGLKQFIHISSLSVITGQEDQYNVDETAPLRLCGEAYADSKVEAEKVVQAAGGQIATTILRPGFIYGPGERAWMPRLITNIQNGKAMLIDGGQRQTNVIYVENLCQAVSLSLLNPKAYGQVYNLTDPTTPTKKELFDAIADGLNLPRVTKKIPRPIVKTVCDVVSMVAPMLPAESRKKLSRFSRAAFRLAGVNQGFSINKAKNELGYTDLTSFSQGMKETLQTFRHDASPSATPQTIGK